MTCNCDSVSQTVRTEISPSEFTATRKQYMDKRKGVKKYDWSVESDQLTEYITVDQSEYEKYNYFKYRNEIESDSNVTVVDIKDGVVKLIYNCVLTMSVDRCLDCHTISKRHQGIVNDTKITECTAEIENQVCANTVL